MGKLSNGGEKVLSEFQSFLLVRKLAPGKNIPYLAHWVSRFLTFSRKRDTSADDYQEPVVTEFLETLRTDARVVDWQVRQAERALRHYGYYLSSEVGKVTADIQPGPASNQTLCTALEKKGP